MRSSIRKLEKAAGRDPHLPHYDDAARQPRSAILVLAEDPITLALPLLPLDKRHRSTFRRSRCSVRQEGEPALTIHPDDAAARGIAEGSDGPVTFNGRGRFLPAKAR